MADLIVVNQGRDIESVVEEALRMIKEVSKDVHANSDV